MVKVYDFFFLYFHSIEVQHHLVGYEKINKNLISLCLCTRIGSFGMIFGEIQSWGFVG